MKVYEKINAKQKLPLLNPCFSAEYLYIGDDIAVLFQVFSA